MKYFCLQCCKSFDTSPIIRRYSTEHSCRVTFCSVPCSVAHAADVALHPQPKAMDAETLQPTELPQ